MRPEPAVPAPSPLRLDDPSPVLDFWIGGPPRTGVSLGSLLQNKTNQPDTEPAREWRTSRQAQKPSVASSGAGIDESIVVLR